MKMKQYALLGALICSSLSAVDSATFDTIIELYKKQQATRKDVINAYSKLEDKQLGDQLLSAFLKTTISTLQSEEARKAPAFNAAPVAVNHRRPECAGKGCGAKRAPRKPQSPNKRQRRKSLQPQQDLNEAKRRSIETALEALDKENLETAKAISLVDTVDDQSLDKVKAVSAREAQEERDLQEAIRQSLADQGTGLDKKPAIVGEAQEERDLQEAIKQSLATPAATTDKKPIKSDKELIQESWTKAPKPNQDENKKPQGLALKPLSPEDREFVNKAWNRSQKKQPTVEQPVKPETVVEESIKPEPVIVSENVQQKPRDLPGIEVSILKDGTAEFEITNIDQYSHKDEELFFWALQKQSKPVLELWGYQLSQKTKTDDARWKALTPLIKSYNKPGAPHEKIALIMKDTVNALETKSCAQYQALPQQLR